MPVERHEGMLMLQLTCEGLLAAAHGGACQLKYACKVRVR